MKNKECNKCDERGMIEDTPLPSYSGHSCSCGKHIRIMHSYFYGIPVDSLLAYGRQKVKEKKQYD